MREEEHSATRPVAQSSRANAGAESAHRSWYGFGLRRLDRRIPQAALAGLTERRTLDVRLHVGPCRCTLGGALPTFLPPSPEALAEGRLRMTVRRRHSRFLAFLRRRRRRVRLSAEVAPLASHPSSAAASCGSGNGRARRLASEQWRVVCPRSRAERALSRRTMTGSDSTTSRMSAMPFQPSPACRTVLQCRVAGRRCMTATTTAPTTTPSIAEAAVFVSQAPMPPAGPRACRTSSSRWWTAS